MRTTNDGPRIYGPYQHGKRWRLEIRRGGGKDYESFETKEDAEGVKAALERRATGLSIEDAVEQFVKVKQARGLKSTTTSTTRHKLRALFGLKDGKTGGPIAALNAAKAAALYKALQAEVAVDTHRNTLMEARGFGSWAVTEGLLKSNPFAAVQAVGQRNKGKFQLSIDESRRYLQKGLELAQAGDVAALAAVLPLLLGLRASEVVMREVRDLDDRGRVLRVPMGKTANARRAVLLPAVVRERLAKLAEGKRPGDRLFPDATRFWLAYHVGRICGLAKVPEVCPHGLRGTHASLSVRAGATSEVVAATLGHSPKQVKAVTEGVYITTEIVEQAKVDNATETLLETDEE